MILLAAVLAFTTPLQAAGLEAAYSEGVQAARPDASAVEAALRGNDRTAAYQAARGAAAAMGSFDDDGQRRVVTALRDAAESGFAAPEVRAEAALQLGESALWIRDEGSRRLALGELLDLVEAPASDSRSTLRRHALKGLATAVKVLPQDMNLETRAAQALAAAATSGDGAERTLALMALRELIAGRPRVAQSQEDPSRRLEAAVLDPILRDPSGYVSGGRAELPERWAAYRVLLALAVASDNPPVRLRVQRAMTEASYAETDPAVKRILENWARALGPR